ncbi:hypothetical protein KPB2_5557 [Klebsiella pneumoniae Kb677]|nr:hypothetical protein KPB2_5557 [Klebsiella pneumoniae Kb677]
MVTLKSHSSLVTGRGQSVLGSAEISAEVTVASAPYGRSTSTGPVFLRASRAFIGRSKGGRA